MNRELTRIEAIIEVFQPDVWTVRPSTFGEFDPIETQRLAQEEYNEPNKEQETCLWVETGEMWETSCGNAFVLNDGTPAQNNMKFCCYCSKPIHAESLLNKTGEQP